MYWIALLTFILVLCYLGLKRHYQYWTRLGISQCDPVILLGNSWKQFLRLRSNAESVRALYNAAPNARYCGVYMFMKPVLLIRDPDLLKQITVKDFDHFLDHFGVIDSSIEPLFGKNLAALKGQKWKEMRSTLSPAFTSSKMKHMFSLITKTGSQLVEYFFKQNETIVTVNMKDAATKFTNDVIANAAFGVECDSLADPKNEFYVMGTDAVDFTSFKKMLTFFLLFVLPSKLLKFLGVRIFDPQLEAFFTRLVKENIESREKQGIVRPDMIHLLMEARKHGFKHEETHTLPDTGFATVEESDLSKHHETERIELSDEDITAQAFIFFLAGFETVSTFMCLISYELALNPDIQKKLKQEIDDTRSNCEKDITYEALMSMKYMDMVISEGMRKWPNATAVDRLCTKAYSIEPKLPGEKLVRLKKGEVVSIPIYGIHRDPNNFPDPERFDPERFSEENKSNIKPYTYLPFGLGPRACIGSRFALLELKVLLFNLLQSFELVPVEKTCIPLVLSKKSFSMLPDGGLWLGLKRRSEIVAQ